MDVPSKPSKNYCLVEVLIINGRRYLINTSTPDGGDSICEWLLKQFKDEPELDWDTPKLSDFTNKIR